MSLRIHFGGANVTDPSSSGEWRWRTTPVADRATPTVKRIMSAEAPDFVAQSRNVASVLVARDFLLTILPRS
jgi:hypothetical protein